MISLEGFENMVSTLSATAIQTVGVIGAGQMGNGIAQVMSHKGNLKVIVQDVSESALEKAQKTIDGSLSKFVAKSLLDESEKNNVLSRIRFEKSFDVLKDADLVVEAIVENESVKKDIFRNLDELTRPHCILASNTSSISITRLASVTKRPEQVIGMHFMNPVPLMKLVEIIRAAQTSDATYQAVNDLALKLDKTTVVSKDFPGFISNRILMPLLNEAMFALYEGIGSVEDIDTVMKFGMNHPMGPLQLADFIGLDTCLSIMHVLYDGFQDARFRPCPLLKQYVDAGWYGKKSGKGFYSY
jgi:3-hydroxybutyryl-CoA dehydrogenase